MLFMKFLDLSFKTPEENLACDEALLETCENGGPEALRFWESPVYFAVLGYSNKAARELNLETCRRDFIPVLRRPSGGGTVLQGPGCLNYALILRIPESGPLKNLKSSNEFIMETNRKALEALLGSEVRVQGITDLTFNGLKFSGNAQRRLKNAFLFHGTFLYGFDLSTVSKYLALPSLQPDYRENRPHDAFITNLQIPIPKLKKTMLSAWGAAEPLSDIPAPSIQNLIEQKYSRSDWNEKL